MALNPNLPNVHVIVSNSVFVACLVPTLF